MNSTFLMSRWQNKTISFIDNHSKRFALKEAHSLRGSLARQKVCSPGALLFRRSALQEIHSQRITLFKRIRGSIPRRIALHENRSLQQPSPQQQPGSPQSSKKFARPRGSLPKGSLSRRSALREVRWSRGSLSGRLAHWPQGLPSTRISCYKARPPPGSLSTRIALQEDCLLRKLAATRLSTRLARARAL